MPVMELIDLTKTERGKRKEWRIVHRKGKVFRQRFEVGRKEEKKEGRVKIFREGEHWFIGYTGALPAKVAKQVKSFMEVEYPFPPYRKQLKRYDTREEAERAARSMKQILKDAGIILKEDEGEKRSLPLIIDLEKAKRKEWRLVRRDGKVFRQRFVVGRKEKPATLKTLSLFKEGEKVLPDHILSDRVEARPYETNLRHFELLIRRASDPAKRTETEKFIDRVKELGLTRNDYSLAERICGYGFFKKQSLSMAQSQELRALSWYLSKKYLERYREEEKKRAMERMKAKRELGF